MESPYATNLSGSTRTWYSRVVPPKMETAAMLGTDMRYLKTTQSWSRFSSMTS